jgi:hypothetical protein
MNTKKLIGALALAITCASPMAMAAPETGDREFTLSGSGSSDKGFDNNKFSATASIGWFTSDALLWGLRQNAGVSKTEIGGTDFSGSTTGFVDYHFDFDRWQPFLGVSLGGTYGDNVDNSFSAGPEFGIKYYVKPKTFLLLSGNYLFNVEESASDGSFIYVAGLGFNY